MGSVWNRYRCVPGPRPTISRLVLVLVLGLSLVERDSLTPCDFGLVPHLAFLPRCKCKFQENQISSMDSLLLVHNLYAQCKRQPTVGEGLHKKRKWCNGGCNTFTPDICYSYTFLRGITGG